MVKVKVKMYVKVKKMSTKQRKGERERNGILAGAVTGSATVTMMPIDDSYLKVLSKKLSATLRLQHGEPQYADGWPSPTFFFFQEGGTRTQRCRTPDSYNTRVGAPTPLRAVALNARPSLRCGTHPTTGARILQ